MLEDGSWNRTKINHYVLLGPLCHVSRSRSRLAGHCAHAQVAQLEVAALLTPPARGTARAGVLEGMRVHRGGSSTVPYLIDRAGVATAVFYVANCHFNSGATSAPHGFVAKGMGLSVDFLAGRVARAPLLQLSRKTGPVSWLPLKVRAASAPSCPNSAGIIGPVCKLWAR